LLHRLKLRNSVDATLEFFACLKTTANKMFNGFLCLRGKAAQRLCQPPDRAHFKGVRRDLRSDEPGIKRAGEGDIRCALNDGAAIGKEGDGVGWPLEAEKQIVEADIAVGSQAGAHGGEVDRAMMLVDLDRVASAKRDVRTAFAGEMGEEALVADGAAAARLAGRNLRSFAGPEIEGEQRTAHEIGLAGEKLERFGDLNGCGKVDGSSENAGGVAGLDRAAGWLGEDAGEAGRGIRRARQDVHGCGVGSDGSGIDPGLGLLNGVVVEQIAGLKVVGGIEDEVGGPKEIGDVGGNKIGDVGVDGDTGIEEGDLAPRRLCLGEGFERVGLVEENLALKIGRLDKVAVDKGESADTSAGEQRGRGGSRSADADDGDMSRAEPLLAENSNARKESLA